MHRVQRERLVVVNCAGNVEASMERSRVLFVVGRERVDCINLSKKVYARLVDARQDLVQHTSMVRRNRVGRVQVQVGALVAWTLGLDHVVADPPDLVAFRQNVIFR